MTSAIGMRVREWSSTLLVEIRTRTSSARGRVDDLISGAWDRLHDAVQSAIGLGYRSFYWYRDHYEHFEPAIVAVELTLIFSGLVVVIAPPDIQVKDLIDWNFIRQHLHHLAHPLHFMRQHLSEMAHPKEVADICIFVLLGASAVSRMLVAARGHSLGYTYRDLGDKLNIDDVYMRVSSAPWGSSPAGKSDPEDLASYAAAIAERSAALLSLRTYYSPDKQWLARDRGSLLDWFTIFPAGLWRLVPEDKSDKAKSQGSANAHSGYYSVIVPTTAASAKHICRGQKATDLAEVDPKIADTFGKRPIEVSSSNPVEFLVYVQLHVPRYERERTADELLFAASVQHIVSLLHGIFGAAGNFRAKWNFVIFCEAANRLHGTVIERLGFLALAEKAHERSEEPTGPGKSYAGFPLLRLKVVNGQPCPDPKHPKAVQSKAYAEKFIQFLEDLTVIYRDRMEERAS